MSGLGYRWYLLALWRLFSLPKVQNTRNFNRIFCPPQLESREGCVSLRLIFK